VHPDQLEGQHTGLLFQALRTDLGYAPLLSFCYVFHRTPWTAHATATAPAGVRPGSSGGGRPWDTPKYDYQGTGEAVSTLKSRMDNCTIRLSSSWLACVALMYTPLLATLQPHPPAPLATVSSWQHPGLTHLPHLPALPALLDVPTGERGALLYSSNPKLTANALQRQLNTVAEL
jgi:hypothetical protein